LTDHVLSDDLRLDRPSTVLTWLYGTVSAGLLEDIMAFDTARAAWLFLEEQFLGEKERRALHLEAKFRKFSQGDLSVAEFSRRLKSMADDLASLDDPLTNYQLALAFLRGLSERFANGPRNDNTPCLDRVLRQSIGLSPIVLPKLVDCASYCRNSMRLSGVRLLSIVTMSVRFISP